MSQITLTPKMKAFGNRQRWILKYLVQGWHISEVEMPEFNTRDVCLSDPDKGNTQSCNKTLLTGLMKRGILTMAQVYSTEQPISFHYQYHLKAELLESVRAILSHHPNSCHE